MSADLLARAEDFVHRTARVLEQRRFGHLFHAPDPDGVRAALTGYETPDGGYGYALEPDGRGPSSQPLHVDFALRALVELGPPAPAEVGRIGGYLAGISRPDGGLPSVLPGIAEYPHAPWWAIDESATGSLIPTAGITGLLHAGRAEHPWLDSATAFCWQRIERITETHPYEVHNVLTFLDHVPDRARAEREAARLGELVRAAGLVHDPDRPQDSVLSPGYAPGEHHRADSYADRPDSLARRWFTDAEFDRALDHLAGSQRDDGGWTVPWAFWTPATEVEWRGHATVATLTTLRAFHRL